MTYTVETLKPAFRVTIDPEHHVTFSGPLAAEIAAHYARTLDQIERVGAFIKSIPPNTDTLEKRALICDFLYGESLTAFAVATPESTDGK